MVRAALIAAVLRLWVQWDGGPMDPASGRGGGWFAAVILLTIGVQLVVSISLGQWLFRRFPRLFSLQ